MVLQLSILLTACGGQSGENQKGGGDTAACGDDTSVPLTSLDPWPDGLDTLVDTYDALDGAWVGTMTCTSGSTEVRLTLAVDTSLTWEGTGDWTCPGAAVGETPLGWSTATASGNTVLETVLDPATGTLTLESTDAALGVAADGSPTGTLRPTDEATACTLDVLTKETP